MKLIHNTRFKNLTNKECLVIADQLSNRMVSLNWYASYENSYAFVANVFNKCQSTDIEINQNPLLISREAGILKFFMRKDYDNSELKTLVHNAVKIFRTI